MATLASDIIGRATAILKDVKYVRWTLANHYEFLTDAQRAVVLLRPGANATTVPLLLTQDSTRQSIPSGGYQLIDVVRNMGADGTTPGEPITLTDRESLDTSNSAWHTGAAQSEIENYTFDDRNPAVFYVTPPPAANVQVEIVYSKAPAAIAAVGDSLEIDDNYVPAVLEYHLYRAYGVNGAMQDFERSMTNLRNFYLLMGEIEKARLVYSPNNEEAANGG